MYVPCTSIWCQSASWVVFNTELDIANYIYGHPRALDLSLKGIWISDREYHSHTARRDTDHKYPNFVATIGYDVIQTQMGAANFVHKYENVFALKFVPLSQLYPIRC